MGETRGDVVVRHQVKVIAAPYWCLWVDVQVKMRYDAEVVAAASKGPEQVG